MFVKICFVLRQRSKKIIYAFTRHREKMYSSCICKTCINTMYVNNFFFFFSINFFIIDRHRVFEEKLYEVYKFSSYFSIVLWTYDTVFWRINRQGINDIYTRPVFGPFTCIMHTFALPTNRTRSLSPNKRTFILRVQWVQNENQMHFWVEKLTVCMVEKRI